MPPTTRDDWIVRVPASSANLGSAFDAVALALDMHLEITADGDAAAPETHPAVRAFRHGGGVGPIAVRSHFPGGRGLGFSGAARVGGLVAACAQQQRRLRDSRPAILRAAAELEGHADNVAASLYGGVVAVAGGRAVRIPLPHELVVVVWIPDRETATSSARRLLPEQIPFADAAFNIGRTALLVAALAAGDVGALRTATEDRLHQDRRLARALRDPPRGRGRAGRRRVRGVALGLGPVGRRARRARARGGDRGRASRRRPRQCARDRRARRDGDDERRHEGRR